MQRPREQPLGQASPHPPQLALSVCSFTHEPLHITSVPEHWHAAPTQVAPAVHTAGRSRRSCCCRSSRPRTVRGCRTSTSPALQMHCPPMQIVEDATHTVPHPPQLLLSVCSLPPQVLLQRDCVPGQVHWPATQLALEGAREAAALAVGWIRLLSRRRTLAEFRTRPRCPGTYTRPLRAARAGGAKPGRTCCSCSSWSGCWCTRCRRRSAGWRRRSR